MTYYFDVMPYHPPPEYFESLTSYLIRLAECNGISSIDGISALSFPQQDRRITRALADYPPVSFGNLMIVGASNEEILRKTTFFHLSAKFGRSTLSQPMSRFLCGCISQYLRYCPICFIEQPVKYYPLFWRFLILTCCCKHKCRLLETCGHCGEFIPLFTSPFKLGNCPKCQQGLQLCIADSVSDEADLEFAAHVYEDIVFFLTPQLWEADSSSIIKRVGRRFAYMRQMKQLTAMEVAINIGVTLTVVEGIERGDFQGKGATLQRYLKYTHYLCLSLKEVFSDVVDTFDNVPVLPLCPTCQQRHCVTHYGYNRSGSRRFQCQHCHRSFTASPTIRGVRRQSS